MTKVGWSKARSAVIALAASLLNLAAAPSAPVPPEEWRVDLIAEAPAIRHPSVVCTAPDGRVFVAEDPMDISAPADAAQGRILCFQPDGHRAVFADKLHAVFGMQYLEGKLYVLHNPNFSVFKDEEGGTPAREELIETTNPNPWALDWNDHVPANFKLAMDAYFYVAVGDKGLYHARGRDGKIVDLQGGGIVRVRPDGTGLEVYCRGVRNILDVALTSEDEIFTYDNTDEHDWMGRLTHMVEGGFYGYPRDFVPRRPYTLWMMADFGPGAATGAFAYTEDALPAEYHDNLFLADFGKRQILRARIQREGATFRAVSHEEMFKNPPEDFRPVGIALSPDGLSIYICDWAHRDTKERVEVGRLWKLTYTGTSHAAPKPAWSLQPALGKPCGASDDQLLDALAHSSRSVRMTAQRELIRRGDEFKSDKLLAALRYVIGNTNLPSHARWHAIWTLGAIPNDAASVSAIAAAASNGDSSVRRQAIRQLGLWHGSAMTTSILRKHLNEPDASIRFAAATVLGRLGESSAIPSLMARLTENDDFARYAVFHALNQIGGRQPESWGKIADGLAHTNSRVREGTQFALRETHDARLVSVLDSRVRDMSQHRETREPALNLLAAVYRKKPPWKGEWWAYHPALQPPPQKTVSWSETARIGDVIENCIKDREAPIRLAAAKAVASAGVSNATPLLIRRFSSEQNASVRIAMVEALGELKVNEADGLIASIIDKPASDIPMLSALRASEKIGGPKIISALVRLLEKGGDLQGDVIHALGTLRATAGRPAIERELGSKSDSVRREAIKALGILADRASIPKLIDAFALQTTRVDAIQALARMPDVRAVEIYLAGLANPNAAVREQCHKALKTIRDEAWPKVKQRLSTLNSTALAELKKVYEGNARASALSSAAREPTDVVDYERFALDHSGDRSRGQRIFAHENGVGCAKCHVVAGQGRALGPDLTLIGSQFGRAALIEHVLYPSKAVREGYAQIIVETMDGETASGLVMSENAETLTLADAGGQTNAIPKSAISKRISSSLSLMPEGLQLGLSLDQFADLIAYLESLKGDASGKSSKPAR